MAYTQTIVVLLIVAGAAYYLIRRVYNSLKNRPDASSCGCNCTDCNALQNCEESRPQD